MRRSGAALAWQTSMKPAPRLRSTCSAEATAIQFSVIGPASRRRRGKDAEAVAIRIEGQERVAEIHGSRRLSDRELTAAPIRMGRPHGVGIRHRDGKLAAARRGIDRRLDLVAQPQAEL